MQVGHASVSCFPFRCPSLCGVFVFITPQKQARHGTFRTECPQVPPAPKMFSGVLRSEQSLEPLLPIPLPSMRGRQPLASAFQGLLQSVPRMSSRPGCALTANLAAVSILRGDLRSWLAADSCRRDLPQKCTGSPSLSLCSGCSSRTQGAVGRVCLQSVEL